MGGQALSPPSSCQCFVFHIKLKEFYRAPKIKEMRSKRVWSQRPGHTPLQKLIDENTIQKSISLAYDNAGKIITGGSLLLAVNDRVIS